MYSDLDLSVNNTISDISMESLKLMDNFINELKKYNSGSKMNVLNKEDYREKIVKLYNDIGGIKPVDNLINNKLFFDDYEEIGLVLNKKNISLKQIWTEYRLIYNEKQKEDDIIVENSFVLDNFDDLFDKLTKRVDGVDNYINELTSMRSDLKNDSILLEHSRESFELEKIEFEKYCKQQTENLERKEKELNNKLAKVDELLKKLEEKVCVLLKEELD